MVKDIEVLSTVVVGIETGCPDGVVRSKDNLARNVRAGADLAGYIAGRIEKIDAAFPRLEQPVGAGNDAV